MRICGSNHHYPVHELPHPITTPRRFPSSPKSCSSTLASPCITMPHQSPSPGRHMGQVGSTGVPALSG
jgi:hypothetical protein